MEDRSSINFAMAFRYTILGSLDDEAALRDIVEVLELTGGNVKRAAFALGISRRHLYRYLWRLPGGWREADRVRAKAMADFVAARARLGVRVPACTTT
jgi:hypothetical protein